MSDQRPMFRGRDGWLYRFVGRRIERVAPPTPAEVTAILDRSRSLANHTANVVRLQAERVRSKPEDPWQTIYDYELLIGALSRFRNALRIAEYVPEVAGEVIQIVAAFDGSLPGLRKMRNVLEHTDQYAVDAQHFGKSRQGNKEVFRQQLQSSNVGEDEYHWLGETLSVQGALVAVSSAYAAIKEVQTRYLGSRSP